MCLNRPASTAAATGPYYTVIFIVLAVQFQESEMDKGRDKLTENTHRKTGCSSKQ